MKRKQKPAGSGEPGYDVHKPIPIGLIHPQIGEAARDSLAGMGVPDRRIPELNETIRSADARRGEKVRAAAELAERMNTQEEGIIYIISSDFLRDYPADQKTKTRFLSDTTVKYGQVVDEASESIDALGVMANSSDVTLRQAGLASMVSVAENLQCICGPGLYSFLHTVKAVEDKQVVKGFVETVERADAAVLATGEKMRGIPLDGLDPRVTAQVEEFLAKVGRKPEMDKKRPKILVD